MLSLSGWAGQQITLVFRNFKIGRIDLDNRVYTLKRAYLIEGDPRANV